MIVNRNVLSLVNFFLSSVCLMMCLLREQRERFYGREGKE